MREIDRLATERHGVPSLDLMENAALEVVRAIEEEYGSLAGRRIVVLAGKGNNGGDALAVARLLLNRKAEVKVFLLVKGEDLAGDAAVQWGKCRDLPLAVREAVDQSAVEAALARADLAVDGLFGTGLKSPLTGVARSVVEALNGARLQGVVAIDLPSGVDADSGAVLGAAVHATTTVTLALPKRGLFLYPGAGYVGKLRVADIGIPAPLLDEAPAEVVVTEEGEVADLLKPFPPDVHKGRRGHLLVVAGSLGKTGAAVMTARGALRCGAGLVTVAVPATLQPLVAQQIMEAMTLPLAETKDRTLAPEALEPILQALEGKDVLAIGPGLSTHTETVDLVRALLPRVRGPVVLDADSLNALAGAPEILRQMPSPCLLTPHPGEMGRLMGAGAAAVQGDRLGTARAFALRWGVYVVLKGAHTVMAMPDGRLRINPTGGPGMATGGTGDVLTGMLGALLAQGFSPEEAMTAGVYLHGKAGELAEAAYGERGMVAGDLIEQIPEAILRCLSCRR
jgi:NAD(P)H-hydrate epimerase